MRRVMLLLVFAFSFIFAASVDAGTFSDDFNDGNDDGWLQVVGNWEVVDGVYRTPDALEEWRTYALGGEEYGEYTIEAKMRNDGWHSEHGHSHAGIFFGDGRPSHYGIYFRFHSGDLALWHAEVENPGVRQEVAPAVPLFDAGDVGNWHLLKVEVSEANSTLNAWVDGEEVYDNIELQFGAAGRIALFASVSGGCSFDDVSITGDSIGDSITAVQPDSKLAITWGRVKAQY